MLIIYMSAGENSWFAWDFYVSCCSLLFFFSFFFIYLFPFVYFGMCFKAHNSIILYCNRSQTTILIVSYNNRYALLSMRVYKIYKQGVLVMHLPI